MGEKIKGIQIKMRLRIAQFETWCSYIPLWNGVFFKKDVILSMSSPDHSWYGQLVVTFPHSHLCDMMEDRRDETSWQLWHLLQLSKHLAPNYPCTLHQATGVRPQQAHVVSPVLQSYPSGQFYCCAIWPPPGQLNQHCLVHHRVDNVHCQTAGHWLAR